MREQRKIVVGPFHLGSGRRFSKTECPVALALRQQLGGRSDVSVDLDKISYGRLACPTPSHVQDAIMRIDSGMTCEPFAFSIDV